MDSQAFSSDEEDDKRTISMVATDADTVATDADASSIYDMVHKDPEFDSLRLNSVVISRVPDEVMVELPAATCVRDRSTGAICVVFVSRCLVEDCVGCLYPVGCRDLCC